MDGRSKIGRVMSLLAPAPRLSVLPPHEAGDTECAIADAQPENKSLSGVSISQDEEVDEIALVPQRVRPMYAADSSPSMMTGEDSLASQFQVMTAQRYQPFPARILKFSGGRRLGMSKCSLNKFSHYFYQGIRGPPLSPPPTTPLPLTPDESLEEGRSLSPKLMDKLAAGMLPILLPGLTIPDYQSPMSAVTSDLETSGDRCKNEVLETSADTPHAHRQIGRALLNMMPPEDQSTPRFRFPKDPRPRHSLPPLVTFNSSQNCF